MKTKFIEKGEAIKLRQKGLSIKNIAKILDVGVGSVSLWVRNIEITSEQHKNLLNRTGEKQKKKFQTIREEYRKQGEKCALNNPTQSHIMGCMLYWGEGEKSKNHCGISNTDPNIIKIFLHFLRENFNTKNSELLISIRHYQQNQSQINAFWKKTLELDDDVKIKYYLYNDSRSETGLPKNLKHPNGICTLRVRNGTKIVQHIFGAIKIYGMLNHDYLGE